MTPALTLPKGYHRRLPLDLSVPCWHHWATPMEHGYVRLMVDGTNHYVHRLAYQLHVGPIPRGWEIDHACHSQAVRTGACGPGDDCHHRGCASPYHLEAVTSAENSARGNHPLFAVARLQVCRKGLHDLTDPANVYVRADGRRRCRPCALEGDRRRAAR